MLDEGLEDPAALLERARALEPSLRFVERAATLDRLQAVLAHDVPPAPAERDWQAELLAERAMDATSHVRLDEALELADKALKAAAPTAQIAILRATMARARALAWTGTDTATRQADLLFIEAEERCRVLGHTEWQGTCMYLRAHTVFFQNGAPIRAAELMREALEVLGPASPRRSTVLTFFADVLTTLGAWDDATAVLEEARSVAERDSDAKSRAYSDWSLAHISSARGDALATERRLREVERDADDWFSMDTGTTFLADAAEMLDRVGLTQEAYAYLARAEARDANDELVLQARATLLARSGDPWQGIEALRRLVREPWLEKRLLWRHLLLIAWATFRAGREGAGELALRALNQVAASGGLRVAAAGEPDLLAALAPLAERAGSRLAREHLLAGRQHLVRVFGTPVVVRADGTENVFPAGKPGELVRMLALHEHGLPVDAVMETFFPDAAPSSGRHRLRQVLLRLRAADRNLITRDGDNLRLAPAWVDVQAFTAAANRARADHGPRAVQFAYAALALHAGPLLPTDPYARWAEAARDTAEYRHRLLVDIVAADAAGRGSHQEALTALESLGEIGPAARRHLRALGHHAAADSLEDRPHRPTA